MKYKLNTTRSQDVYDFTSYPILHVKTEEKERKKDGVRRDTVSAWICQVLRYVFAGVACFNHKADLQIIKIQGSCDFVLMFEAWTRREWRHSIELEGTHMVI
jgi:hypothetical protein